MHSFLKKGCILISASSSDREFDAVHLRKKMPAITNCHDDVCIDGINLINCGFPVNFDGGRHSVAPSSIQLTRALLAAAIFQSCGDFDENYKGFVSVNGEMQYALVKKFLEIHNRMKEATFICREQFLNVI